jgi:hypothetical protein
MSGFLNPQPTNVNNDVFPREGSKVVPYTLIWANAGTINYRTITINLQSASQTGQFSALQGVFVDNTTNICPVRFASLETGFSFIVPPFTSGFYPILASQWPNITATIIDQGTNYVSKYASYSLTTKCYFVNTPSYPYENALPLGNTAGLVISGQFAWIGPLTFPSVGDTQLVIPGSPGAFISLSSFLMSGGITTQGATGVSTDSINVIQLIENTVASASGFSQFFGTQFYVWSNARNPQYIFDVNYVYPQPIYCQLAGSNIYVSLGAASLPALTIFYIFLTVTYGYTIIA